MADSAASSASAPGLPAADDRALLAACRAGDARAFAALARRHHPALRALAGCWPGGAHDAERDVAQAWRAILDAAPPARAAPLPAPHRASPLASSPPLRARVAREVVLAAVDRTHAALEPAPGASLPDDRFFASDHELWPGEWADPPRPWGSIAERRLAQRDIPRALARIVRELGIAPNAALTLCDVHGWPVSECAFALDRPDAQVLAFLRAGREGVRAALEQEVDGA